MLILKILLIIIFLTILFFDVKERAVYWWIYIILGVVLYFFSKEYFTYYKIIKSAFVNTILLLIQFVVVQLYFTIKTRRYTFIVNKMIGFGDILFLLMLTLFLPSLLFFPFLSSALSMSIIVHVLARKYIRNYTRAVPLAGYISLCSIPVVIFYENILYTFVEII